MPRIAGVNLSENKKIPYALTQIYGVGINTAIKIVVSAKISPDLRTKDVTSEDVEKIRRIIDADFQVEGDLKSVESANVKRLKDINTYRGVRHTKNLPVRGQRTKTNARTKRGKKVTMGSGRKQANLKT